MEKKLVSVAEFPIYDLRIIHSDVNYATEILGTYIGEVYDVNTCAKLNRIIFNTKFKF